MSNIDYSVYSSFVKPVKFQSEDLAKNSCRFTVSPIERGYGVTIGNSLRRASLGSIRGCRISEVKIDGVTHEFSHIDGVVEDTLNICMNLKLIAFKMDSRSEFAFDAVFRGPSDIKAGDLNLPKDIQCMNPELHLFSINKNTSIHIRLKISSGFGSNFVDDQFRVGLDDGSILLNCHYSPVLNFSFNVEDARHDEFTDYDKLIIDVTTDGSISPSSVLGLASSLVRDMLEVFVDFDENLLTSVTSLKAKKSIISNVNKSDSGTTIPLDRPISEFEFSVRTWNCMQIMGIQTIGDLVAKSEKDLLRRKNFGKKSLNEVKDVLEKFDLSLSKDSCDD